ncbi:MAG: hypothetical protein ABI434_13300 [Burkholderiaceae bacterium]
MFQDDGRFGLLGKPRRCWAPVGVRPVVGARLVRKFSYAFAAVCPHDGVMDSLVLPWVNAQTMSLFLSTLVLLPPYSPEINPSEYIWKALREDCVGNTVFANLEAADKALCAGLRSLESSPKRMQSLCGFNWIISIRLNAK